MAKHVDAPDENEDVYHTAPEHGRIVVADGASESFDARTWAHLIVEQAAEADLSAASLDLCVEAYGRRYDPAMLSWSKAAAFERGSFATLLVVQDHSDRQLVVVSAVGDSIAVLTDGQSIIETAPYRKAHEFLGRPTLLSSRSELNAIENGLPTCSYVEWPYEAPGYRILLCMTDALGAWLLRHQERGDPSALERLHRIRDEDELLSLVESERATGELRRDDTTLIVAAITSDR